VLTAAIGDVVTETIATVAAAAVHGTYRLSAFDALLARLLTSLSSVTACVSRTEQVF